MKTSATIPGSLKFFIMKKSGKVWYTTLVTGTVAFFLVILAFAKEPQAETGDRPAFRERSGTLVLSAEWLNTKAAIEGLLAQLETNPEDGKAMLQLAQAYIQEGRITGDHAFYDKAALEMTDKILATDTVNFETLCCKATVLLSQHHFSDALVVAEKARSINPHNAFIYGLLCDAYVELGNYEQAVAMADKMISIRPDIRSYSRVSYLREIHGDMSGAIGAMKLAVSSGYPGLEQTEWSRMVLAHLYESTGSLDSAEMHYAIALQERPDYPFALAGMGRIEKAKGNYTAAIAHYEKAKTLIIEYSFADELTDLYLLAGDKKKADQSAKETIELLGAGEDVESIKGHGHYADRELAYAYLKTGENDKALQHALTEYRRRPGNIDVAETLAWVRYRRGEYVLASALIGTAMRTHSRNPQLLCRAGLIKIKYGHKETGIRLIREAFAMNPFLDPELKKEAQPYLAAN